jgi:glycosyltransferase involved in cell wall biosynthesis
MLPKLSILIPFYNGNKYIRDTINSIYSTADINNTPFEVVIINDSPQTTIDIDTSIYPNLFVYTNTENMGIAQTRNIAFLKSCGEYILFLDQDDMLDKDFWNVVKKGKLIKDLYILNISLYNEKNGTKKVFYNHLFWFVFRNRNDRFLMRIGPVFKTVSQMIFRREYFEPLIYSKSQGGDDYFFYISLFKNCPAKKREYINDPIINYRIHENNYSHKANFYFSLKEIYKVYNIRNNRKYEDDDKYFISMNIIVLFYRKILLVLTRKR